MRVLLVRHGHAGTKRHWDGDDSFRPLDEQGLAESVALARIIAPFTPARIVSSPFLRCMQSVAPLAAVVGIEVERSQSLVPDAGTAATSLARSVTAHSAGAVVLCTHGEVIRAMQTILGRGGLTSFGPDAPREKGSIWVLDRIEGQIVSAEYLQPPQMYADPAPADNLG